MNNDIYEALEDAGFGSNVHEVASDGDCRVLRLDDDTGEGFMTMYRVFDGIYLMYNDLHMAQCRSEYRNTETVICIDHCREGRIEHENAFGGRYYMEAGDVRIDKRIHHEGSVHLPLAHYHGLSVGFQRGIAGSSLKRELPFLKTDLDELAEKFCAGDREFLIRGHEQLDRFFSGLYRVPKNIRLDYFRVKVAELLLLLGNIEPAECSAITQYFPASQTEKIKEIHALITGSLDKTFTVGELSGISGMPPATLRKIFRARLRERYPYLRGRSALRL